MPLCPRLVFSGLSGGSGKTLLTLGLVRALVRRGKNVQPSKKGPDYIDTAWLSLAAKNVACNIDPYFSSESQMLALADYFTKKIDAEMLIIEGNRGLYDGKDSLGTCSTAHIARLFKAPVIMVLPCTKMTRTMAAIVYGLLNFEQSNIAGLILNKIGSERHGRLVQKSIAEHTDVPIVGLVPRLESFHIQENTMGLVLPGQTDAEAVLEKLANFVELYVDVPALINIAKKAPLLDCNSKANQENLCPEKLLWPLQKNHSTDEKKPRIGIVKDKVFSMYYEENFEALRRAGAELVFVDLFDERPWPELDGLYIGGGFTQSHAKELATAPHLATIKAFAEASRPVYAECGGFLLLCQSIALEEIDYKMAAVFPLRVTLCQRPQALGYVDVTVKKDNPFFKEGQSFRGHSFHYTRCQPLVPFSEEDFIFSVKGGGMGKARRTDWHLSGTVQAKKAEARAEDAPKKEAHKPFEKRTKNSSRLPKACDALLYKNTFGAYTYVYAPAVPEWAENFVALCHQFKLGD